MPKKTEMNQRELDKREWEKEYQIFNASPDVSPPQLLTESVFQMIERKLHPSPWIVFLKLLGIHSVVSTSTLFMCGQFGVSLRSGSMGLMDTMMIYGDTVCMLTCGFIFLGGSVLMALVLFGRDNLLAIKRTAPYQISALALLSLLGFLILPDAALTFNLVLPWLLGAMAGGYSLFLGGFKIREKFQFT